MLRRMSKPVCPQRPVSAFKFSLYCLQLANAHCQKGKRRKRWVVWKKMRLQTAGVVYPTNWRRSCQKSEPPNKCESQWPGRLWSMFSCDKQNDHNMILSTSYFKYVWNCCFSNTDIPENSWMESNCEAFVLATLWHYGDTMVTLWWHYGDTLVILVTANKECWSVSSSVQPVFRGACPWHNDRVSLA